MQGQQTKEIHIMIMQQDDGIDEIIQQNSQTSDKIHYENQSETFKIIQEELDAFLDLVRDDILQEEQEINDYLNDNILKSLDNQEKMKAIQYLLSVKQDHNKLELLNNIFDCNKEESSNKSTQQNDRQFYLDARNNKEYIKIFNKFTNEKFIQVNKIPFQISSNKDYLEKILNINPQQIHLLFNYNEYQEGLRQLTQIELLQLLTQFIDDAEEKLQQIIGSISIQQCSQFQTYINWIQIQDQKQIITIQNQQFLKELLSLDLIKIKEDLIKFITQQIHKIQQNNHNRQKNQSDILRIFGVTLQKQICCDIQIDQIYFAITFYFWIQHSQKIVHFHQHITQYLLRVAEKQKENIFQTKIKKFQKENLQQQDSIHDFLMKKIIFYKSDMQKLQQLDHKVQNSNELNIDNIQIYFSTILNKYFNMDFEKNDLLDQQSQFIHFGEQLLKLQFYQIRFDENDQASKFFIQILWINHQNDIIFEILQDLPRQESELIIFLHKLESLNKKLNNKLYYLILDILEFIIIKDQTNFLYLKIFRDQFEDLQQFLCLNNCINLYTMIMNNSIDILYDGIKMLQEIFCDLQNQSVECSNQEQRNLKFLITLGGEDYGNQFLMLYHCYENNEIKKQLINAVIRSQFYNIHGNLGAFKQYCEDLYMLDEGIYNQCFEQFKDKTDFQITPKFFKHKKLHGNYPNKINILIEQFNLSRTEKKQNNKIIEWVSNLNKNENFLSLLPFLFDIIKRGESIDPLLEQVNKNIQNENREFMNFKAIFQILYNNSDKQLQMLLLKHLSLYYPIPFLYQNSNVDAIQEEQDLYLINPNIYYFIQKQYSIINFSFSRNQSQIGKTELINKVFYRRNKFSIQDTNDLNRNTIDLMFDYEFNGSRNLLIADTHGCIPQIFLLKILPLFSLWIIQMDTEQELNENLENIKILNNQINIINHQILFILRNQNKQIDQSLIEESQKYNIKIQYIQNLASQGINNQLIQQQIKNVQKYIFQLIMINQEFKPFNQDNFIQILKVEDRDELQKLNRLVQDIKTEVSEFFNQPKGFQSQKAFPLRYYDHIIKELKEKESQLFEESNYCLDNKIEELQQKIENCENTQTKLQPTKLIKLFKQLVFLENYTSYTYFIQVLYDLTKEYNQNLWKKNLDLIDKIHIHKVQNRDDEEGFNKLKQDLEECEKELQSKSLNIDIFWRELIKQGSLMALSQQITDQITKLLMKGESFELLDGEQFRMNINMFELLVKCIEKIHKNNKILVIGILGPQSSGKSTILNKIFGCHFFSSVGKSTKGIYFKMIEIKDKSIFENQFDHILILDTEGLQSPNQKDPLFDKRISLFIFAICDIILINVKGEINSQFKNLVEICIYSLAQIQNALSNTKQISWCFNQNIDTQNKSPFIEQLTQLTMQLFHDDGSFGKNKDKQQDILELIDINNENVQILSTTTTQETWNIEELKQCWTQLIPNESYSKDAYNYGIKLIETYINKCKKKQQRVNGQLLENFFFNSYQMWETISKLPDLLEFSELIQLQQNQLVSAFYYQLWNENKLTFKSQIPTLIKQKLDQLSCDLNLKCLFEIQQDLEQMLSNDCGIKIKLFEEQLKQFKEQKNIQNNIYQKFIMKLYNEIYSLKTECNFFIQEQIKNEEIIFQKSRGFKEINNYINQLKQEDRIKLQNDEKLMENVFKKLWGNIKIKYQQERKKRFDETQTTSLKQIKSYFQEYQLNIEINDQFQSFIHEKINKKDLNETEKKDIFDQYSKIILKNQFVKLSEGDMYQLYFQDLNIDLKILKSQGSFLPFSELIQVNYNLTVLLKEDLKQYFNVHFKEDLKKAEGKGQNIQDLFKILDLFKVKYNQNIKEKFLQCINKKGKEGYLNSCYQFIQTIEYNDLDSQFQFSTEDQKLYEKYLKSKVRLRIIQKQNEEINNLIQNYIIISKQVSNLESKVFDSKYCQYILDSKNYDFLEKFPIQFNNMLNQKEKWIRIYSEIYDQIKIEMLKFPDNVEIISKDLIQVMMLSISDYVENHYKKLFYLYGLQLSNMGERYIYYYSLHIIWRFYCLRIWKQQEENEKQFNNGQKVQLQSFKLEIYQHKVKLSQKRGEQLANYLIEQYQQIFYQDKRIEIVDLIMKEIKQNKNLVQQLDDSLLNQKQKIELLNEMTYEEQVVEYLTDQLKFIQNYVEQYIKNIKEEIKLKYQELLNKDFYVFFERVEENAKRLLKYISNEPNNVNFFEKTIRLKFYECDDNDQKKYLEIHLENKLFNLVFNYLLEYDQNEQEIQEIDDQYKDFFIHYQEGQGKIHINQKNNPNNQIYNIQGFFQSFLDTINKVNKGFTINFDLEQFLIYENLNSLKIQMIGCSHCCPICNRKCDQNPDCLPHSCVNGHYLRGIKGILLGNGPSLQSCEEIQDNQIINIQETQKLISWKKIKKCYQKEWNFENGNNQKIKENKIRLIEIWNNGIGNLICNQLSKNLNINIDYKRENEFKNEKKIFYIFILDDSFSMEGQKGNQMMECLRKSLKFMKSNREAKLSVISFNYKANLQIEFQTPKQKLIQQIILVGGMTNFDPPLILSLDQIRKFQNDVDGIQIMLYSDGDAPYPQNSLNQFKTLNQELRNKISFLICTAEKKPLILLEMVEQLTKEFIVVELKHNIQSQDLSECWNEVLLKGQLDKVQ